jgi:hypothetical protein
MPVDPYHWFSPTSFLWGTGRQIPVFVLESTADNR